MKVPAFFYFLAVRGFLLLLTGRTDLAMRYLVFAMIAVSSYFEFKVLAEVSSKQGFGSVILFCILSAYVGIRMVRSQGAAVIMKIQQTMMRGAAPALDVVSGLFLLLAGFLFFVPGFLSDALGLLLLVPWVRTLLARLLLRNFSDRLGTISANFAQGGVKFYSSTSFGGFHQSRGNDGQDPKPSGEPRKKISTSDPGILDIEADEILR